MDQVWPPWHHPIILELWFGQLGVNFYKQLTLHANLKALGKQYEGGTWCSPLHTSATPCTEAPQSPLHYLDGLGLMKRAPRLVHSWQHHVLAVLQIPHPMNCNKNPLDPCSNCAPECRMNHIMSSYWYYTHLSGCASRKLVHTLHTCQNSVFKK